jgi:hypothetical protein
VKFFKKKREKSYFIANTTSTFAVTSNFCGDISVRAARVLLGLKKSF